MKREDIFPQPDENSASGVAADAAIGDLHAGKASAQVVAPALGDGVAEKDEGVLVLLNLPGPRAAALGPKILEPGRTTNRAGARESGVGGGKLILQVGRRWLRRRLGDGGEREQEGGSQERDQAFHRMPECWPRGGIDASGVMSREGLAAAWPSCASCPSW